MDNSNVEIRNIPLDTIEALANIEALPKSEHWFTGVAWILMEANRDTYTERAIQYFKKALTMKPGGWVAMEGLARCYGVNLRKYETAIEWMENAILNLPVLECGEYVDQRGNVVECEDDSGISFFP